MFLKNNVPQFDETLFARYYFDPGMFQDVLLASMMREQDDVMKTTPHCFGGKVTIKELLEKCKCGSCKQFKKCCKAVAKGHKTKE